MTYRRRLVPLVHTDTDRTILIAAAAVRERCDLIAMSTHGHRLPGDLVLGSVANEVRHQSMIPVLLVRAKAPVPETHAGPARPVTS